MIEKLKTIEWLKVLQLVLQSAVAALTALGITACYTCVMLFVQ